MKKINILRAFCVFVTVTVLFNIATFFCRADNTVSLSAKSAILMDFDSGKVLYDSNATQRMGMASTTKIMTALTVMRLSTPDRVVTVPKEAVGIEGSSVYLCEGERLTVEQLLYALLLSSANDAAVALAIRCAGSVESFANEMNAYAYELGLTDTHFVNPHGLDDKDHYTTAYDLALIAKEALGNRTLRAIFSTYKTQIPFDSKENARLLVNHNKLLRSYEGAIGMKTGFTKSTGRCLVSAAEREGLTLICVTLNAPDDWRDHTSLLNYGFDNYQRRLIADTGEFVHELSVSGGVSDTVTLTNTTPLLLTLPKHQPTPTLTVESHLRFAYAPVKRGYVCAEVSVCFEGELCRSSLVAEQSVECKAYKKGLWQKIIELFKRD